MVDPTGAILLESCVFSHPENIIDYVSTSRSLRRTAWLPGNDVQQKAAYILEISTEVNLFHTASTRSSS